MIIAPIVQLTMLGYAATTDVRDVLATIDTASRTLVRAGFDAFEHERDPPDLTLAVGQLQVR